MGHPKRIEELKRAQPKLAALVEAVIAVRGDSTAAQLLEEVLMSTADGTGTNSHDLQHLVTIALAHCYARIDVEQRQLAAERAA